MDNIKEVTVFSMNGNPRDITTWSNIPYFLVKSLEERGIKVNCVELKPSRVLYGLYRRVLKYLFIDLLKNSTYSYFRSYIHFKDINTKIKNSVSKFPNSDAFIFTTFSFSAYKYTKKPSVLLCDWNYDYYFNYFEKRKPRYFESQSIRRDNIQIQKSEIVISLYPGARNYMSTRTSKNIQFIGNVINSTLPITNPTSIIEKKKRSDMLLFVGKKHYSEGAIELIKAFKKLKEETKNLTLHIIGMEGEDFNSLPDGVICHGYLNKSIEKDRELYYSLLSDAKMIINTTPKWGGFSSVFEAMYYCNPVITTPYNEFVLMFGKDIPFGSYINNDCSEIYQNVKNLISNPGYDKYCINSYNAVKLYTWENYISGLLKLICEHKAKYHNLLSN